jgi:hypothetical protein
MLLKLRFDLRRCRSIACARRSARTLTKISTVRLVSRTSTSLRAKR